MKVSVTWQDEDMARVHSLTASASYMKDNSKKTKCMDMVVRYNQTGLITSANGTTIIAKEEAISNSWMAQSMRANGVITESMAWAR